MVKFPCVSLPSLNLQNYTRFSRLMGAALLLTLVGNVMAGQLSGAIAQSSPQSPPQPSSLTWEDFTALTTIPVAEITHITVHYQWEGWADVRDVSVAIEKTPDGYRTDTGEPIQAALIEDLSESLTQLRWSSRTWVDCTAMTDSYSSFNLNISFDNGEQVQIQSGSNCALNIPWSVTYQGNQYVQYTGEIPLALYPLLAVLPGDPLELAGRQLPSADDLDWIGDFWQVYHSPSPANSEDTVTEETLYQQVIESSDAFAPFAPFYDLSEILLSCSLHRENPQCLNLEGHLILQSKTTGDLFFTPVQMVGSEIGTMDAGMLYNDLGEHAAALNYYQAELPRVQNNELSVPEDVSRVLTNLGWTHHHLGQYDVALRYYQRALDLAATHRDLAPQILNYRGQTYAQLGQYDAALNSYQEALTLLEQFGADEHRWQTFMNLGSEYYHQGQYEAALTHYYNAFTANDTLSALTLDDPIRRLRKPAEALSASGKTYTALGWHDYASIYHLRAFFHQYTVGDQVGQILTLADFGNSLAVLNEPELAILFLKSAVNHFAILHRDGQPLSPKQQQIVMDRLPNTYQTLAELLRQRNRPTEAQQAAMIGALLAGELPSTIPVMLLLDAEGTLYDRTMEMGTQLVELERTIYTLRSETEIRQIAEIQEAHTPLINRLQTFLDSSEIQALINQL